MWQQSDDGVERNWQDAKDCCKSLEYAGYDDWRLPEVFELKTLVDHNTHSPAIDTSIFGCGASLYWSSTTRVDATYLAWLVYFYDGYDDGYYKDRACCALRSRRNTLC